MLLPGQNQKVGVGNVAQGELLKCTCRMHVRSRNFSRMKWHRIANDTEDMVVQYGIEVYCRGGGTGSESFGMGEMPERRKPKRNE